MTVILATSNPSFGYDEKYANLTEANIQIVENGELIQKANILLLDNNKASVTFVDTKTNKPVSKIYITSSKNNLDKSGLINIDIDYLTYENYEWLPKIKSTVLNEAGEEGVVSILSGSNTIEVVVTATSRDNEILKSDSRIENIGSCSTQDKAKKDCCEVDCTDGSGNTLTCCGAVSCSACGTSCSPGEAGTIGL